MLPSSITVEKLNTLVEINSRINSNYEDIDSLLLHILESAMRLVQCESSSLLLVDKNDTLKFRLALGPKGVEVMSIPVKMEGSIAGAVVKQNSSILIDDVENHPLFFSDVQKKTGYVTSNMIAVPLRVDSVCVGVVEVLNKTNDEKFNKSDLEILELLCGQAGIAYKNATTYHKINYEIDKLKASDFNSVLYQDFIGQSQLVTDMLKIIDQIAKSNSSVLILGESGVGKEVVAKRVHHLSDRCDNNFVCVNCATLSPQLLESELFGHVRGAFTDAVSDRVGRFELADGGTIFLDEIGEMPLSLQVKLLRVIQFREFEKVGSNETKTVDVRIIAATNRNLEEMVKEGSFRSDLFFRLNVLPVTVAPLRKRIDDIELLANHFLQKFSVETNKQFTHLSEDALKVCKLYQWPGNVRELENSIERACVLGVPPVIQEKDLCLNIGKNYDSDFNYEHDDLTLADAVYNYKKYYVNRILKQCDWNNTKAAKVLDVQRTYVSKLISELDIKKG